MAVILAPSTRVVTPASALAAWHLCSLDAPTIAVLWTAFLGHTGHVAVSRLELAAMFVAVWMLYATDRLLDARTGRDLAVRHHFHQRHAGVFKGLIGLGGVMLLPLMGWMPRLDLTAEAVLALGLIGWFALVHLTALRLPKELVTAVFFAAAVAIPSGLREPRAVLPAAVLFGLLCLGNGLFIAAWEEAAAVGGRRRGAGVLGVFPGVLLGGLLLLGPVHPTPAGVAVALAAGALLALDRYRLRLAPTTLRAAADLALLTPALVWPFLR